MTLFLDGPQIVLIPIVVLILLLIGFLNTTGLTQKIFEIFFISLSSSLCIMLAVLVVIALFNNWF